MKSHLAEMLYMHGICTINVNSRRVVADEVASAKRPVETTALPDTVLMQAARPRESETLELRHTAYCKYCMLVL